MKGIVKGEQERLSWRYDDELLYIEAWGRDSLRVRSTHLEKMPEKDWALEPQGEVKPIIKISEDSASITNGKICAKINTYGYITFYNEKNEEILKERWETREVPVDMMATENYARVLKEWGGTVPKAVMTFESNKNEKIYGMGQYQMEYLDLKGCELELCHKNSQTSIPFYISNKGYGFLWNNPAVGTVNFAKNLTRWTAEASCVIDYWITAGETPAEILENYTAVSGRPGEFPKWASGFWQSKLRYHNQEEVLETAREYKRRGLPLSVIVIDFFHWKHQGDWSFDPEYFPDPQAMVDELKEMGVELMVSVWPTVEPYSENYARLKQLGFLTRADRGVRTQYHCLGAQVFFDPTTQGAREFLYEKLKENYGKYGIRIFWLDEAEPEYQQFDYDIYRYQAGSAREIGGIYPLCYSQAIYDGMKKDGIEDPMNLTRSAWAGSQKFGTLLWSGDIYSSFRSFRMQIRAGLNAGMAGIAWWTSDIGGFWGGDPESEEFRELLVRWFQFGVFSPICRLHGHRRPSGTLPEVVDSGMFDFNTCGPNEVWSYGEKNYGILKELLMLRERMRPYVEETAAEASETGLPMLRTLFFNYPEDENCWETEDEIMLGRDLLAAPVTYPGMTSREVYLPKGDRWIDYYNGKVYEGGQTLMYPTPLEVIPFFIREGSGQYEKIRGQAEGGLCGWKN